MDKPSPVPQCRARQVERDGKVRVWHQCPFPADGELVYDKPGVKFDISWPYCEGHGKEFAKLTAQLWWDPYEEGTNAETEMAANRSGQKEDVPPSQEEVEG